MKIAIHHRQRSFSDRWIDYCRKNNVNFKIVNCYDNDILEQISDCNALMWHWSQEDYEATLFARQLTFALEKKGIPVFPDSNTSWHFDDKIGQKYLLEAIGAPLVKSYAFYSKNDALTWINSATFPKVFKLRGGAGSINVKLIKSRKQAKALVKKAFGKGFSVNNPVSRLKDRFWVFQRDNNWAAVKGIFKGFGRLFIPTKYQRFSQRQKGYIYFQDFIPENNYDTRLVVIGDRCFGIRRYCRKGDFRASGSGILEYAPELFQKESIIVAFKTACQLSSQSIAFDFILDNNQPKIVEISYTFSLGKAYDSCPGFWDKNLNWHDKKVNPQYFMIEDFLQQIENGIKS